MNPSGVFPRQQNCFQKTSVVAVIEHVLWDHTLQGVHRCLVPGVKEWKERESVRHSAVACPSCGRDSPDRQAHLYNATTLSVASLHVHSLENGIVIIDFKGTVKLKHDVGLFLVHIALHHGRWFCVANDKGQWNLFIFRRQCRRAVARIFAVLVAHNQIAKADLLDQDFLQRILLSLDFSLKKSSFLFHGLEFCRRILALVRVDWLDRGFCGTCSGWCGCSCRRRNCWRGGWLVFGSSFVPDNIRSRWKASPEDVLFVLADNPHGQQNIETVETNAVIQIER